MKLHGIFVVLSLFNKPAWAELSKLEAPEITSKTLTVFRAVSLTNLMGLLTESSRQDLAAKGDLVFSEKNSADFSSELIEGIPVGAELAASTKILNLPKLNKNQSLIEKLNELSAQGIDVVLNSSAGRKTWIVLNPKVLLLPKTPFDVAMQLAKNAEEQIYFEDVRLAVEKYHRIYEWMQFQDLPVSDLPNATRLENELLKKFLKPKKPKPKPSPESPSPNLIEPNSKSNPTPPPSGPTACGGIGAFKVTTRFMTMKTPMPKPRGPRAQAPTLKNLTQ